MKTETETNAIINFDSIRRVTRSRLEVKHESKSQCTFVMVCLTTQEAISNQSRNRKWENEERWIEMKKKK